MSYDAKAIEVMIASPSDVQEERAIVRKVVNEWNDVHSRERGVCLMPVGWETHSSPELGSRPQQIINDRILIHCDLLVGIFWTRVGSPTGKAISGSVEEIEQHRRSGKPAMLYFSSKPVVPDSLEIAQYDLLKGFKAWALQNGLVEFFESTDDFRDKFTKQLQMNLSNNEYLKNLVCWNLQNEANAAASVPARRPSLSADASELLRAAVSENPCYILTGLTVAGRFVQAGSKTFTQDDDSRSSARWRSALEELTRLNLVSPLDHKGEVFDVTHLGFQMAERLS